MESNIKSVDGILKSLIDGLCFDPVDLRLPDSKDYKYTSQNTPKALHYEILHVETEFVRLLGHHLLPNTAKSANRK